MSEVAGKRLSAVIKELNISLQRAVDFLKGKGVSIDASPNTKIAGDVYDMLVHEFETDKSKREKSEKLTEKHRQEQEAMRAELHKPEVKDVPVVAAPAPTPALAAPEAPAAAPAAPAKEELKKEDTVIRGTSKITGPKTIGKIDLDKPKKAENQEEPIEEPKVEAPEPAKAEEKAEAEKASAPVEEAKPEQAPVVEAAEAVKEDENKMHVTEYKKLTGPVMTGQTIDLDKFKKPEKKATTPSAADKDSKRKRKRIKTEDTPAAKAAKAKGGGVKPKPAEKRELTDEEIQKQIKETLEKLTSNTKSKGSKYRKAKREERREKVQQEEELREAESRTLQVTEFVTVDELATMMNVPVTQVIGTCMQLGIMVTMNQRLDAETLSIVAEEFNFEVEFVSADLKESIEDEKDDPADLVTRPPIVTVMGHVDHGKTSLLDYIRKANVIAGESGGITQHIGAYEVTLQGGQQIAFIDTPGHEAFTAMRARGAKVTDIAIIVVAADDNVMPQTKEAISHAQAAGVPIVFAINKVDKQDANPEKIKESLANLNLLVEDWGGKIQSHDISAKTGLGVAELLEKVLLEAEIRDLKANPKRNALGTVIEASLDKGRGYVTTVLVQNGTLNIGDYLLAGQYHGKVKAMFDERGKKRDSAGPSTPVMVLGLDGAPQAGDDIVVMKDEREAKAIATRRQQLQREQSIRTSKHITLDEIGRRLAIGEFKELNIILKGDVDGSIEALADSLQKLSTSAIQVNIIHKAVGQVTESDVLLASASDAIIIGFQVRPSVNARKLAEKEQIDIRLYSIIYDAINEVKDAMEGMLSPEMKEEIVANVEIREVFKITKVGSVAGCMVLDGKITRNNSIRVIRDGVVVYTGRLGSLKRFKDDVKEVTKGYECGLNIDNFNDIKVGDIVEAYEEVAVKKTL
jgi:translation initiation factor IF-2